jgi:hypothetical protein
MGLLVLDQERILRNDRSNEMQIVGDDVFDLRADGCIRSY